MRWVTPRTLLVGLVAPAVMAVVACGTPAANPSPTPSPNVQATVSAAVEATAQAGNRPIAPVSGTPTATPALPPARSTQTPGPPTPTPAVVDCGPGNGNIPETSTGGEPSRFPGGYYLNPKYCYRVLVPVGWTLDARDQGRVTASWGDASGKSASIQVSVRELDPLVFPTLESFVAKWQPSAGEGWEEFVITGRGRFLPPQRAVEAYQFSYSYAQRGVPYKGVEEWYLLGRCQISVSTSGHAAIWSFAEYKQVGAALDSALTSFKPQICKW